MSIGEKAKQHVVRVLASMLLSVQLSCPSRRHKNSTTNNRYPTTTRTEMSDTAQLRRLRHDARRKQIYLPFHRLFSGEEG